jgi:multicomponent Na+:H+ antiporter subunit E
MWEFMVAITEVVLWVFRPNRNLNSVIVTYPLKVSSDTGLWLLALIISLTPGSLVLGLSPDSRVLYIHFLHSRDPEKSIGDIRKTFEDRLAKVFG